MTKTNGKARTGIAAVLACLLTGLGGFKSGEWYAGLSDPLTPEGAYKLLSGISDATNSKIMADYEKAQRELAEEAARRAEALTRESHRREAAQKAAQAAQAELELAEAQETVRELQRQTAVAERELTVVVAEPPRTEQAAEIQAKAARAVRLLKQKNEWLRGVVDAQGKVIERQELVIREFQSEVAEYERNLFLWKERYEKAEKHIGRFGSRRTKIAAAVLGAAAGVYVGMKVF